MTDVAIKEQIRTIKKASAKATESKESAIKFLQDAGLLAKGEKETFSDQKPRHITKETKKK